jgi:hypothetical protein
MEEKMANNIKLKSKCCEVPLRYRQVLLTYGNTYFIYCSECGTLHGDYKIIPEKDL